VRSLVVLLATSISDSVESISVSVSEPVLDATSVPEEVLVLPLLLEPPVLELVVVDPVLFEPVDVEPVLPVPVVVVVLLEPTQPPL